MSLVLKNLYFLILRYNIQENVILKNMEHFFSIDYLPA